MYFLYAFGPRPAQVDENKLMNNLLSGVMPYEPVQAALRTEGCRHLLDSDLESARSCQVQSATTKLLISLVGPLDFRGEPTLNFFYPDVFGLADTVASRDAMAQGFYMAPIDAALQVLSNPPIDVHHINLWSGYPCTFV